MRLKKVHKKSSAASPVQVGELNRLTVLFTRLSGYMAACLQVLKKDYGTRIQVFRTPPAGDAPFETDLFTGIDELHDRTAAKDPDILREIFRFKPEAVLMAGWSDFGYLGMARRLRKQGVSVIAGSDAQWKGSIRQNVARLISRWYLHTAIDVLWVAGVRQERFAKKLGYVGDKCWDGYYSANVAPFADSAFVDGLRGEKAFLFVGRYVPVKGLDVLLKGYGLYRTKAGDPWPLYCIGTGPLQRELEGQPGVIDFGFIQPCDLPSFMHRASAFVLPSNWEPWGVVLHEASAAGLPLVCSDACGASERLLVHGENGFLFPAGNPEKLAAFLLQIDSMSDSGRADMSRTSRRLSLFNSPEIWAKTFVSGLRRLG